VGWGGRGQNCTKTFLGQVGICVQNFIKIRAGVWIAISPPYTNRPTDKPARMLWQIETATPFRFPHKSMLCVGGDQSNHFLCQNFSVSPLCKAEYSGCCQNWNQYFLLFWNQTGFTTSISLRFHYIKISGMRILELSQFVWTTKMIVNSILQITVMVSFKYQRFKLY